MPRRASIGEYEAKVNWNQIAVEQSETRCRQTGFAKFTLQVHHLVQKVLHFKPECTFPLARERMAFGKGSGYEWRH